MLVFVHEFCCSGAFPGDLCGSSLAREGLAMLTAIVEDFLRCDGGSVRVATTLDSRLRDSPSAARIAEQAQVDWAESPDEERNVFQKLAGASQATLVIAPEPNGWLLERRQMTDAAKGRFLGHSSEAIRLCGDKLGFHDHLRKHALPTIPTSLWDLSANPSKIAFPIVVKPRYGAGSVDTLFIRDPDDLQTRRPELIGCFSPAKSEAVVQPYLAGRAISVAALVGSNADRLDIFPLAEQRISRESRFCYRGGRIPAADISPDLAREVADVIRATCRSLPGLSGYIGFDLIMAHAAPRVRIVEANPRLTTSYIGYRCLTLDNLAARMLFPDATCEPIAWNVEVGRDELAQRALAHHRLSGNCRPEAANAALSHPTNAVQQPLAQGVEFDADGEVRFFASSER